jgi:hypothetical protein
MELVEKKPTYGVLREKLADACKGDVHLEIRVWNKLVEKHPSHCRLHEMLTDAYECKGDIDLEIRAEGSSW